MTPDHPRWPEYEARFRELAFLADETSLADAPAMNECRYYLCLYGENGLSVDEEFAFLDAMESFAGKSLCKRSIQTGYWEDILLFVP
ncbi:MAG: hypothetical protein IPK79_12585 [Vampirovibrionales bacterium]|nr:hypothetical protein [Vampirovibrionales bacterium]